MLVEHIKGKNMFVADNTPKATPGLYSKRTRNTVRAQQSAEGFVELQIAHLKAHYAL